MLLVNFTIPFTIFFTLEIVFIVRFLTRQERLNACRKPVSDSSDCLLTLNIVKSIFASLTKRYFSSSLDYIPIN